MNKVQYMGTALEPHINFCVTYGMKFARSASNAWPTSRVVQPGVHEYVLYNIVLL